MAQKIRVAGVVKQSVVDGPGLRLTVFTQGCPHKCAGCHNPGTHDFDGGWEIEADDILEELDKNPLLKGITLSGGEPLSRSGELLPLTRGAKERGKDVICFTGYTFEELLKLKEREPALAALLPEIDLLVDGRFDRDLRDLTLNLRGSGNQRVLDLPASLVRGEAVWAEGYQE
ncbi:MAG: anaerobic ribonucleoside-triphosphate reductase activating protein [Oscillospiraceae bacterium]|nr:anaerobic ribonucleoside-triphosphate reductase activating protein [Oscillospiraceae bacterium]